MPMKCLVPNITLEDANLFPNDYVSGLLGTTAPLGLAAHMAPLLGVPRWDISVLTIYHSVYATDGQTRPEFRVKSGFRPAEKVEDMRGDIRLSLIFDIPDFDDAQLLGEVITGCTLAGGTIISDLIEAKRVSGDGSCFSEVAEHVRGGGYILQRPNKPNFRLISSGDEQGLAAIAKTLFPATRISERLVPIALGFRLLEAPEEAPERYNTRDAITPHVFAEPVVGVGELVSIKSPHLMELTPNGVSDLFWRWSLNDDWILTHPKYKN